MLIHSRAKLIVQGRRIDDDIEEALGIVLVESNRFVLLDGLLCVFQGAGHNKAAGRFSLQTKPLVRFAASPSR